MFSFIEAIPFKDNICKLIFVRHILTLSAQNRLFLSKAILLTISCHVGPMKWLFIARIQLNTGQILFRKQCLAAQLTVFLTRRMSCYENCCHLESLFGSPLSNDFSFKLKLLSLHLATVLIVSELLNLSQQLLYTVHLRTL